jgi:hypothetical protein
MAQDSTHVPGFRSYMYIYRLKLWAQDTRRPSSFTSFSLFLHYPHFIAMACNDKCSISNELTSLFNIKHPIMYV